FAGSGAVLLRRLLRLLLTLDAHPHALYEKERLLVAVARLTLTEPPQKILPTTALQAGWQEVAATSGTTLEAVLRDLNRNALLMKQQDEWAYIHPIFPAF